MGTTELKSKIAEMKLVIIKKKMHFANIWILLRVQISTQSRDRRIYTEQSKNIKNKW